MKLPASAQPPRLLSAELRIAGGMDTRVFELLRGVEATGSILRAAATVGLSHKGARLILENAANLAQQPLLASVAGGAGGGGTRLTPQARVLLEAWDGLRADLDEFLGAQEARLSTMPELAGLLRRMSMKTTARNQYAGTISALELGPVSAQVTVRIGTGDEIVATMTAAAAKRLDARVGQEALVLVKASAVVLVTDFAGWKLSARNQLSGTVSRMDKGQVSSLVVLTLPGGGTVSATVTNEGAQALGLKVGVPATAVFKAYSVMVAVRE